MIRLSKTDRPDVLTRNCQRWTEALLEAIDEKDKDKKSGAEKKYNHPKIKDALVVETVGKCAYCESLIRDVSFGHIEHLKPKSKYPELCFEWTNLTLACEVCNKKKHAYDSDVDPLINPYIDDPSDHLNAQGPWLFSCLGSDKGVTTITELSLNRIELLESRKKRLEDIWGLADRWHRLTNDYIKNLALNELRTEASRCGEYSYVVASYLRSTGVPI